MPYACPTRDLRVLYAYLMRALREAYVCPSRTLRLPYAWHTRVLRVPHACPTRAPFWEPLRGLLEASWRPLGGLLEASWRPLGGLLGALERPWTLLASPKPIWDFLTSAFERSWSAPEDQVGPKRSPKVFPKGPQSA